MKESFTTRILRIILYAVFLSGALIVVTLPVMLDQYMIIFYDAYSLYPNYRAFIMGFLMLVGSLGLWLVAELIVMLRTIASDTGPFVSRNASALRRMGIVAIVISLIFFAKCLLYVTFLTLMGGVLLFICAMAAFTLASLFRQAVDFKEENDLTI